MYFIQDSKGNYFQGFTTVISPAASQWSRPEEGKFIAYVFTNLKDVSESLQAIKDRTCFIKQFQVLGK